ncbi:hypothetical protein HGRIS_011595 [Hohenbuehelia grisea]|uniref:Uncharacterized protein n=1 Tax=Hohenbuehelia grisea TaxID=104357 RepID=A0ABR3JWJ8_9AGAR
MTDSPKPTIPDYVSSPPLSARNCRASPDNDALPSSSPETVTSSVNRDHNADSNGVDTQTTSPLMNPSIPDVITEDFPPFDVQSMIVKPFQEETDRDVAFEEELGKRFLDVMRECNAWASSRPKYEREAFSALMDQSISTLIEAEMEQDGLRKRLADYLQEVQSALERLAGF